MAFAALKRRTDDTPTDDRPADLIAAEAQVAEMKARRATLEDQHRRIDPDDAAEIHRIVGEIAALNAEMAPIRAKMRTLREAHEAAVARAARPFSKIDRIAAMTPRSDRHELAEDRMRGLRAERDKIDAEMKAIASGQPIRGETIVEARKRSDGDKIALARPLQRRRDEVQQAIDALLPDVRAMRRAHAGELERALADERKRAAAAIVAALAIIDTEQAVLREIVDKVNRVSADFAPLVPGVEVRALRTTAERLAR